MLEGILFLGAFFFISFFKILVLIGATAIEYWDLVNAEGNIISSNHPRGNKLPVGLYHQVVNILVQHQDGSILVMQRGWQKSILPGKFEASTGGSVL